jgi:hypothetical protein
MDLVRRLKQTAYTTRELGEEKRVLTYVARHCTLNGSLTDRNPFTEYDQALRLLLQR